MIKQEERVPTSWMEGVRRFWRGEVHLITHREGHFHMHAPAVYHSFVFFSFEFEISTVKYAEASSFAFNLKKVSFQSAEPIQNTKYKIQCEL